MIRIRPKAVLAGVVVLAACAAQDADAPRSETAPPGAPAGTCWAKAHTPATVETVTEHILVEPEARTPQDGLLWPAVYRTETKQEIVEERRETWFETPCPDVLTPEFIASLQRALAARGHYGGTITGRMDTPTRAAIRRYQTPLGVNSSTLSLSAAQSLGLTTIPNKS